MIDIAKLPNEEMVISQRGGRELLVFNMISEPIIIPGTTAYTLI